jgi:hypothetical protein
MHILLVYIGSGLLVLVYWFWYTGSCLQTLEELLKSMILIYWFWFTGSGLLVLVYCIWFTGSGLLVLVHQFWFTGSGMLVLVYWFLSPDLGRSLKINDLKNYDFKSNLAFS